MRILFPSLPFSPRQPDPDFAQEYHAAQEVGFATSLYDLEALRAGDTRAAFAQCPPAPSAHELLIYRGWMLRDTDYAQLYAAVTQRGYAPLTTPAAYTEAHELPLAYEHLREVTPQTVWVEGQDRDAAWSLYQQLVDGPVVLKDYVKSAKHRWHEACFLPPHTPRPAFERILDAFVAERGDLFEKGLVFRRYHRLVQLGEDLRGRPIHEEYRLFCLDGKVMAHTPFPSPADLAQQRGQWEGIAARFTNRFVTLDVARQEDGAWNRGRGWRRGRVGTASGD